MKFYFSSSNKDVNKIASPSESLGGWQIFQGLPPTLSGDFMPFDTAVYYRCIYANNELQTELTNLFVTTECSDVEVEIGLINVEPNCMRYYVEPIQSQYEAPQNVTFEKSISTRAKIELHITAPLSYQEQLLMSINGCAYELLPYPSLTLSIENTAEWIVKNLEKYKQFKVELGNPTKTDNGLIYDKVLFIGADYETPFTDIAFSSVGTFQAHSTVIAEPFDDRLFITDSFPANGMLAVWIKVNYRKKRADSCDTLYDKYVAGTSSKQSFFNLNFLCD